MLLERACGLLLKYSRSEYPLGEGSEYPLDTESTKDLRRKQTPGSSQEVVFEGGAAEFREGSEAGAGAGAGAGGGAGAEGGGGAVGGEEGSSGSVSKAQLQARARAKVVLRIDQVVGIMFQAGVTPSAKFTNIAMTAYR